MPEQAEFARRLRERKSRWTLVTCVWKLWGFFDRNQTGNKKEVWWREGISKLRGPVVKNWGGLQREMQVGEKREERTCVKILGLENGRYVHARKGVRTWPPNALLEVASRRSCGRKSSVRNRTCSGKRPRTGPRTLMVVSGLSGCSRNKIPSATDTQAPKDEVV